MIVYSDMALESLREIINVGIGRGASVLNMMLNSHIELQVPVLRFVNRDELLGELSEDPEDHLTAVAMSYSGEISGDIQLVFLKKSAAKLITALVGSDDVEDMIEDMSDGALVEMGNVVLNGVMGSISNALKYTLTYSVPTFMEETARNLIATDAAGTEASILVARTRFKIQEFDISGVIVLFFNDNSVKNLLQSIETFIEDLS